MKRKCVERSQRVEKLPDDVFIKISQDIDRLQLCISQSVFESASKLFLEKWLDSEHSNSVHSYISYFKKQWLDSEWLDTWYEGYAPGYPSTSNSIESINSLIKKFVTMRKKIPIQKFLQISIPNLVQNWSLAAIDKYNKIPIIDLPAQDKASDWLDSEPVIQKVQVSNKLYYFVRSSQQLDLSIQTTQKKRKKNNSQATSTQVTPSHPKLTKKECSLFLRQLRECPWEDFDTFSLSAFSLYFILLDESDWKLSTCSCPSWFKNYYCKHSIAIANLADLFKFDQRISQVELGERRKRGAPKKVRQALHKD
jgi:hypothetical protein